MKVTRNDDIEMSEMFQEENQIHNNTNEVIAESETLDAKHKTYGKPVEFLYSKNCNVKMHYSISKDKKRVNRIIVSLESPEIKVSPIERYGDKQQLVASAKTEYADLLYARIPKGALFTAEDIGDEITLATILGIHPEEMNSEVQKYSSEAIEIQKKLCEALSDKDINSINPDDCMTILNDYVGRSIANAQDRTKKMDVCTKILKRTFDYCVSCGFCAHNPISQMTIKRPIERIITQHMKQGALTKEQDLKLYQKYEKNIFDPVNLGIALMHLQGIDASVVCGLKFGDIYNIDRLVGHMPKKSLEDLDAEKKYIFFISRSYRKISYDSGIEYKITSIINGVDSYRYIPISATCMKFIAKYYWHLRSCGLDNEDLLSYPIICGKNKQGEILYKEHMKPDVLRKYVKQFLNDIGIKHQLYFIPPLRSSDIENIFQLDQTKGLLRSNFQNKAKYECRFSPDELNYYSGRKPKSVDARHYRDFREKYNQLCFNTKINRWIIREEDTAKEPGLLVADVAEQRFINEKNIVIAAPSCNADRAHVAIHIKGNPGQPIQLNLHSTFGMNGHIITKAS